VSELPKGWSNCKLEACVEILDSQRKPINNRERQVRVEGKSADELFPYYGATGKVGYIDDYLFDGEFVALGEDGVPFFDILKKKAYMLEGKTWVNNHAHVIKGANGVNNKYLYYYLNQVDYHGYVNGATRLKLTQANMRKLPVKLAPLNEQIRITDKLDSMLAKVDAAQARLDKIPNILKRFRQSVLAAATSGELTKEWRERHKLNSQNTILKIKEQNVLKKKKLDFDTSLLPELPNGWNWTQVKEVGHVQLGRQRAPKYHSGENMKPYLRVMNVKEGYIDSDDIMEMVFDESDYEKYRLFPEDILLNEGQSFELIGRPAIYNGEVEGACFTNTLVRFRAHSPLKALFSFYVFMHYMKNGRFQKISTRTVNISHLGAGRFAELEFPFPPIEEQNEIVRRVESLFTMADTVEKQYKDAKARTNRLTQSILAKAFRGEIVPQDPNDEPANELLARIKEDQTKLNKSKVQQSKTKKTANA
jgi:type I restriction enzyme S subunit